MEYFDKDIIRRKNKKTNNTLIPPTPEYLTGDQMLLLMSKTNNKLLKIRLSHLKKLTDLGFNVVNLTDTKVHEIIDTLRTLNKKDSYISLIISTLKRINPNLAKINFHIKRNKNYKQITASRRFLTNYIGSQNVLSNVVNEMFKIKTVNERYKTLGEGFVDCYIIIVLLYFVKNMLVYDIEKLMLSDLISIYRADTNSYLKFIFHRTEMFKTVLYGLITLIKSRQIEHDKFKLIFPSGAWDEKENVNDKITILLSTNTNASNRILKQLYIIINKTMPDLPYGFKMFKTLGVNDEEIKIGDTIIPIIHNNIYSDEKMLAEDDTQTKKRPAEYDPNDTVNDMLRVNKLQKLLDNP